MRRKAELALIVLAACGRIHFAELGDADRDTDRDADRDAPMFDASPPGCIDTHVQLTAAADDGEIYATNFIPDGENPTDMSYPSALYFGHWFGAPTWGYFRFAVPASAVPITALRLELWAEAVTADWDASRHAMIVALEVSSDAPVVVSAAEQPPNGRMITTGLRWPASGGLGWPVGQWVSTPNLKAQLDQLPQVPAGAHLQVWIQAADATTDAVELGTPDSSINAAHGAQLVLTTCN